MQLKALLAPPAFNIQKCRFLGRITHRSPHHRSQIFPNSPRWSATSYGPVTLINPKAERFFSSSTQKRNESQEIPNLEYDGFENDDIDALFGPGPQQLTHDARWRRRPSPSAALDHVLYKHDLHHLYALPNSERKVDLSYVSPRSKGRLPKARLKRLLPLIDPKDHSKIDGTLRIQSVLARYIDQHKGSLELMQAAADYRLEPLEEQLLAERGFKLDDVRGWATVLLGEPEHASEILTGKRQPSFLVLYFLRRKLIPLICLERILWYLWRSIPEAIKMTTDDPAPLELNWSDYIYESEEFFILAVVRILRHARKTSITVQEHIRTLVVEVYGRVFKARAKIDSNPRRTAARLSFIFNRLLTLFSMPTSTQAKDNALTQQKLQFDILRYMASHEPPLLVSIEGYKALVRVQLAMPKTANDRLWANLKAKTWPPVKEDKTGMDATITAEKFGISRANQVLRWMQEAGYSRPKWYAAASVLSGWDTDGSPTIQMRTSDSWLWKANVNRPWPARIMATRTVEEAWACFLAWDKTRSGSAHEVFHVMFQKLFAAVVPEERYGLNFQLSVPEQLPELPGDNSSHVFLESKSPYQRTYVERPVPDVENFLKELISREHIRPRGRFLALLLKNAPNIDFARHVLLQAQPRAIEALQRFLFQGHRNDEDILPDYLLTAYISLLCRATRSSNRQWRELTRSRINSTLTVQNIGEEGSRRLQASRLELIVQTLLATQAQRKRLSTWSEFFDGVFTHFYSPEDFQAKSFGALKTLPAIASFQFQRKIMKELLSMRVDLEPEIFKQLCRSAVRAGLSCAPSAVYDKASNDFRRDAAMYLRGLFTDLARKTEVTQVIAAKNAPHAQVRYGRSSMLSRIIPGAVLHSYVRALGVLRDYEGMYSVVCFIVENRGEITAPGSNLQSLRTVLIAIRVFIERRWRTKYSIHTSQSSGTPDLHPKAEVILELIKEKVESVSEWDGWPTEDEVEAYYSAQNFSRREWSDV